MKMHFIPLPEFHFLKTYESQTIPLYENLNSVSQGDYIAFLVDGKLAGYSKITSVSDADDFIQLDFYHILDLQSRLPIQGKVHNVFLTSLGSNYTALFHSAFSMGNASSNVMLRIFDETTPSYTYYQHHLEEELSKAEKKLKRDLKLREKREEKQAPTFDISLASEHTKAQHYLKSIGAITGCDVWMASNDHHRSAYGELLKEGCLKEFPNLSLEDESLKRIKLIDTIWFYQGMPKFAFETECSTAIFSGLLRAGDLLAEMPLSPLQLIIVAPESRRKKVLSEMNRPLFKKIGLTSSCKFITLENLEKLYENVYALSGHVLPSAILAYAEDPLERSF